MSSKQVIRFQTQYHMKKLILLMLLTTQAINLQFNNAGTNIWRKALPTGFELTNAKSRLGSNNTNNLMALIVIIAGFQYKL